MPAAAAFSSSSSEEDEDLLSDGEASWRSRSSYVILEQAAPPDKVEEWRRAVGNLRRDQWTILGNQKDKRRENTIPGAVDKMAGFPKFAARCAPGLQAENLSALRKGNAVDARHDGVGQLQRWHLTIAWHTLVAGRET